MPHPPVPRVYVDADVLATRTPFCWLAMLRDETDGGFRLVTSDDTLRTATEDWRSRHPGADAAVAARRAELLRAVLDDVVIAEATTGAPAPDDVLCLVDDEEPASVRAVTLRRQDDLERRRQDGIPSPSLTDALVAAGCPAFAARVAAHLHAVHR
ncbi:MAG: hypothetical protein ACTHNQ_18535 [Microbacterium sp.]|uniref:hypothetical protein n=1 Tax=Microbacterium sp. TaxID=51671 RepID=UPI003F7FED63